MNTRTRARRTRLLLVAAAVATAIALVPVAGSAGRYVDPSGDSGTAPDITGARVTGDATGQVVFTLGVGALPTEGDAGVLLMLDTDLNGATGEPETAGADYVLELDPVAHMYGFGRWAGTEWDWDTPSDTVRVFSGATTVTVTVNRRELGGTAGLNFWTRTWFGDDADTAPDVGLWNYSFAADGPEIRRVLVTTTPKAGPKAGKRFTLAPAALELPPSGEPPLVAPRPDSYTCRASLGSRAVTGTGTGRCSWLIPKTARKKKLTVVVTVAFGGATKAFTYAFRVS